MCGPKASHTAVIIVVLLLGGVASWGAQGSKSGSPKQQEVTGEPTTSPRPTAEGRIALVIGNSAYAESLANPVNDATDMASALQQMGFTVKLLRDAGSDASRGDPPRLSVADQAAHAATDFEADLGQLRRLAGPCLPAHDDHSMRGDGGSDFVAALRHRQLGRVADSGNAGRTFERSLARCGDGMGQTLDFGRRHVAASEPGDPARKRFLVDGHAAAQVGKQAFGKRWRDHRGANSSACCAARLRTLGAGL